MEDTKNLPVRTLTLYEVFNRVAQQRSRGDALVAVAAMKQGTVAVEAAALSLDSALPLAEAVILTTAPPQEATLWTQDAHFKGMAGVEYRPARVRREGGG